MASANNYGRGLASTRAVSNYEPLPARAISIGLSLLQILAAPTIICLAVPAASAATLPPKKPLISSAATTSSPAAPLKALTKAAKTSTEARALADKIMAALGGFDN